MQKNFEIDPQDAAVSPEMLEKINRYTRKALTADEVFVFTAALCDNEVDRDYERFTVDALKALAPLFEGKTAIQNHSMNSADQSARTFLTEVVTDPSRTTSLGEPYTYLKAYCYMPRIPKNETLIAEINAGIKKEVSVGCAVSVHKCSICGNQEELNPCGHRRGKRYNGETCHYTLEQPSDAYEWSFVAVPAQKNAGVTKGFADINALCKQLHSAHADSMTLTAQESTALADYMDSLESAAELGKAYRAELQAQTVKDLLCALPALESGLAESLCAPLSAAQLKALSAALSAKSAKSVSAVPQLCAQKAEQNKPTENNVFKF